MTLHFLGLIGQLVALAGSENPESCTSQNKCLRQDWEVLSSSPRIYRFTGFASEEEMLSIEKQFWLQSGFEKSIIGSNGTSTWDPSIRNSRTGGIPKRFEKNDTIVDQFIDRLHTSVHLPRDHGEALSLTLYGPDEYYTLHLDSSDGTRRTCTLLLYLSGDGSGLDGGTVFPYVRSNLKHDDEETTAIGMPGFPLPSWYLSNRTALDEFCSHPGPWLRIPPRRGDLVAFYNHLPNGDMDKRTLHGSCPVADQSEKLVMQTWVHDRPLEDIKKISKSLKADLPTLTQAGMPADVWNETWANNEASLKNIRCKLKAGRPSLIRNALIPDLVEDLQQALLAFPRTYFALNGSEPMTETKKFWEAAGRPEVCKNLKKTVCKDGSLYSHFAVALKSQGMQGSNTEGYIDELTSAFTHHLNSINVVHFLGALAGIPVEHREQLYMTGVQGVEHASGNFRCPLTDYLGGWLLKIIVFLSTADQVHDSQFVWCQSNKAFVPEMGSLLLLPISEEAEYAAFPSASNSSHVSITGWLGTSDKTFWERWQNRGSQTDDECLAYE